MGLPPGSGALTLQRAAGRTAWSTEAKVGRRARKQTGLGRAPLGLPSRRKVLVLRVAQKVDDGATGCGPGKGLGRERGGQDLVPWPVGLCVCVAGLLWA